MFAHKYRFLFVLGLSVYTYISTVICEVYRYFNIHIEWYTAMFTILLITLGIWECNRIVEPYFHRKASASKNKIRSLLIFFLAGCLITTFITVSVVFIVSMVLHTHTFKETIVPLKLNLIYAWLANLLFHLLNAVLFYFNEYKIKAVEAEQLKSVTAQTELQLIKNQINPHFLFNNLNVLSALIIKNTDEANKFIEEFSKVYRYILNNHDKELIEVKNEVEFIKPYIFLMEKRFSSSLKININITKEYESFYIIPASIQMLIENAIKHNVVSKSKPLVIDIHSNGNNTIVVSNNIQLRDSVEYSTKVGLTNISKRYKLVGGRGVEIDKTQENFVVKLPLINLN
jgi:two-component system, LytTR family, sensor kinase